MEKGKSVNVSLDNDNTIPQSYLHETSLLGAPSATADTIYGMPANFYSGQMIPPKSVFKPTSGGPVQPPFAAGSTAPVSQAGQFALTPEQPTPLAVIPNKNPVSNVNNAYTTIAHTSPPLPKTRTSSYGVPNDVFDDLHHMQNPGSSHVNTMNALSTMQYRPTFDSEFARTKEELAGIMKKKLGIDMGTTRLYQKPYKAEFDNVPYPQGWRIPDFVKFSGEDSRTTWEHISQYLAQLGEAGLSL